MKKTIKHTESQIAEILREARRTSVTEVVIRYNVSAATIYAWDTKFGQLGADEIKRLRHLKSEHARRQRLAP
jgi:transposase